jgi:hypothetical protein
LDIVFGSTPPYLLNSIKQFAMKRAMATFYSLLAAFLLVEFLLTLWSVVFHNSFFIAQGTFANDHIIIRVLTLGICLKSLRRLYLGHIQGNRLTNGSYRMLLGFNAATSSIFSL